MKLPINASFKIILDFLIRHVRPVLSYSLIQCIKVCHARVVGSAQVPVCDGFHFKAVHLAQVYDVLIPAVAFLRFAPVIFPAAYMFKLLFCNSNCTSPRIRKHGFHHFVKSPPIFPGRVLHIQTSKLIIKFKHIPNYRKGRNI